MGSANHLFSGGLWWSQAAFRAPSGIQQVISLLNQMATRIWKSALHKFPSLLREAVVKPGIPLAATARSSHFKDRAAGFGECTRLGRCACWISHIELLLLFSSSDCNCAGSEGTCLQDGRGIAGFEFPIPGLGVAQLSSLGQLSAMAFCRFYIKPA